MSGHLDLGAVKVLGVAQCHLDAAATWARDWPCPACGDQQPLDRAWALKIRNFTDPALERAVVVCNDCFVSLGDLAADVEEDRISIAADDDPVELLGRALDTDEVEVAFRR